MGLGRPACLFGVAMVAAMAAAGSGRTEEPMTAPSTKADFHVAPGGKDTNPGTAEAPFATLQAARDAVRGKVRAGLTGDVLVLIRGGTYPVTETLTFGPDDSGTEKFSITYAAAPGEKVVLSGGRTITGWKKGAGEIWTAEVPEVKAGKLHFRQLFVNGQRARRARTPNVDDRKGWWSIKSCNFSKDKPAPSDVPVVLSVSGKIADYANPTDIEFVHICNNDMGRKRLAGVSAADQTLTLATPNKWNNRCFKFDWYLSIPTAGGGGQTANLCYLENALEFLDQPGEWYLDRRTGVLSYWPRAGEDLDPAEVVAPVLGKTLLAVVGTPQRPVRNLHFRGLRCRYVDWPPPVWGYMGLFCCNVQVDRQPSPGHRFIDAAVEFIHARDCSFRDGEVAHVGAMGVCLRDRTSYITIEGNEIADTGGGGIGLGGCNVAAGYLNAAPPPGPDEYKGYRIANNHVHHCGADYYGAVGIAQFIVQDCVVANNLIHDTAYFGMGVAGSQDPKVPFVKNNLIERNHIHNAMRVTVDGAGMYVAMGNYGRGTIIRDNLIHDIVNGGPCGGLYIDTNNTGCHYRNNVIYQVPSGRALIVNFSDAGKNTWRDNLIQNGATLPKEFIEAIQSYAGLEAAYRQPPTRWTRQELTDPAEKGWSALQYDLPAEGRGVIQVIARDVPKDGSIPVKPRGLDAAVTYELRAYAGTMAAGLVAMLGNVAPADPAAPGLPASASGRDLLDKGLSVKIAKAPQVVWMAYRRAEHAGPTTRPSATPAAGTGVTR